MADGNFGHKENQFFTRTFSQKFPFSAKIPIFLKKFRFFVKFSIFWPNLRFLAKVSILEKVSTFGKICTFYQNSYFFRAILNCACGFICSVVAIVFIITKHSRIETMSIVTLKTVTCFT